MTGGNIVGLRAEQEEELILEESTPFEAVPEIDADWSAAPPRRGRGTIVASVVLILLAVAWVAFVVWSIAAREDAFANLAMIIGAASAPLALIGVVGLLTLRTSRRESARFLATEGVDLVAQVPSGEEEGR